MKSMVKIAAAFGLALALTIGPGFAQQVQVLGDFRNWSAFTANDGAGIICFSMSKPKDVAPTPDGYTQAYVFLTTRSAQNIRNEFNLIAGYEFDDTASAVARVGSRTYDLYTKEDAAWLKDVAQTEAFARSLRAGATMTIEGTTKEGVKIVQTYSLSGVSAASRAVNSAC
ncbi:hypothetical protein MNBD_ALPHA12-738 [hydrothermal vent metagenome]|uniref:Mlr4354 like protein n=1 Tax=hydrothermal vent metagenome TaxID=652676 RepID=A0A3B0TKB5_9ZZZZ